MITTINKNDHKTNIFSLQEELEKSAISPEIAALNFIEIPENFDTDNNDAAELLLYALGKEDRRNDGRLNDKYNRISNVVSSGGWWCGTLTPDGRPSPWGCFKPVAPRKNRDGKIIKYEHPPKTDTQPFFLKVDRSHWEMIAEGAGANPPDLEGLPDESIPHEFWGWVQSRPQVPIVITEGAKKAASLLSAGFCAIGLPGIWAGIRNPLDPVMGQKSGEHHLIPELVAIAQPDRQFIFCFDQDEKPKTIEAVNRAIAVTGGLLCQHTGRKSYSIMRWDGLEGKGIDDIHATFESPCVHRIFADREEKKVVVTRSKAKREAEEKAIAEALAEAQAYSEPEISDLEILEANAKAKIEALTSTPLQPVSEYDPALDPESASDDEDDGKDPDLTYQEIAIRTIYGKGYYIALDTELYHFNGTHYEKLQPQTEKLKIKAWAGQYWVKDPKTRRKKLAYLNTRSVNAIWDWALLSFGINPDKINPPGLNLANGVLRIKWEGRSPTWKLAPHSHRDYYLYCSEVRFDPKADPTHCNRLLECLDPAPQTALLRQLSAAFDLQTVRKLHSRGIKAAIAKGTGANGKDSIRAAISKIFCNQMTGLGLSEFQAYDNGRKFGLAPLEHSLINWSSENNMGTTLDRIEALNICVTGEENGIWIERKNKDGYAITPRAIHIFNTNQIPKLKSGMESLLSRFVVYDFAKTFKHDPIAARGELKADPRFHDDPQFLIKEVCPALINRLLAELKNLAAEGIDYDSLRAGLDDLQEESTHLWSFVQDVGLEVDPDGKVWVSDLWDCLKNWYIESGTLEIEEFEKGKTKNIWHEQANQYDRNVTGSNQVYKRFKMLFPKIKKDRETLDSNFKGRFFVLGLKFKDPASLLHYLGKTTLLDSPDGSQFFTNSSPASPKGREAKSEGSNEPQTLAVTGGEAVKQNSHKPQIFSVGDIVRDKRTGERLQVVGLPTIGSAFKDQSHACRRECAWWVAAGMKRKGSEDPLEVGCIAEHLQTEELVSILQFSEDGVWAWVERNDISVPARFLEKEAGK